MVITVNCLLMENKSLHLKPIQFCLGSIPNGLHATDSKAVSLKVNVHDFSVDCNASDKSDILDIHNH